MPTDTQHNTPISEHDRRLLTRVFMDRPEDVRGIVRDGGNPRICLNGRPLISIMALRGNAPMVQALLQAGANPRAEDNQGVTPLMYACMGGCSDGHVQSLQYILDAAGPRAAVHMDHAGRNAADYAAQFLNAPQFHILTTMRPARTRSDLWLVTNMLGYGGLAVDALRAITRTSGR